MQNIELTVNGMSCQHCVNAVKQACLAIEGVESVACDLKSGRVIISCEDTISTDALKSAIEEEGYSVI